MVLCDGVRTQAMCHASEISKARIKLVIARHLQRAGHYDRMEIAS